MISQRHRFHGHGSLNPVYRTGRTVRGPLMNLRVGSRDPRRPYRVAVVVSRKVHKSAVTRNRIRRRIYEAVRTAPLQPAPGTDLIFTVFSDDLAVTDSQRLQSAVHGLLKKTAGQAAPSQGRSSGRPSQT